MKRKILYLVVIALMLIIATTSISYAKYVIQTNKTAVHLNIDRTPPEGEVEYSTKDPTNKDVIVTVQLSEPIQEVEGWELSEDKLTLTKPYTENKTEEIIITDLSGNTNTVKIEVNNIDKNPPKIEIIDIKNTNTGYENYANKTHTITATIKITDQKIKSNIDITKINICVEENTNICSKELKNLKVTDTEITFDLQLKEIENNGKLILIIPENFVTDVAGNSSKELQYDTQIQIDNIKPQGTYSQEVLKSGKVKAYIKANEQIRILKDWNLTQDKTTLTKEFPANVSYIVKITDLAQNSSDVEVTITNATYIVLTYASHNSEVGWTYGLGNYDIAGKDAIKKNPKYKTEALAFKITGGVDSDFVRVRGYVHSYWNYLCDYGRCKNTGYKYKLRTAPSSNINTYYSMAKSDLSTLNGEKYIQIGGGGINAYRNVDYDGNNPIPYDTVYDSSGGIYPFGVSGVSIALADYSELSVVYQILVNGKGWLQATTNGTMAISSQTEPMSAIRVAIIPNSELESILQLWNKDVGTYNVDK